MKSDMDTSINLISPSKDQEELSKASFDTKNGGTKYNFNTNVPHNSNKDTFIGSKRSIKSYEDEHLTSMVDDSSKQHKYQKVDPIEEFDNGLAYGPKTIVYTPGGKASQDVVDNSKLLSKSHDEDNSDISLNSDSAENEMIVNNLIVSSDCFLNKAHEMVLYANTTQGLKTYFKLIKISIKALLLLVKKYCKCLNPFLELLIYYKLARIYFTETENLNRADDYVNKAYSIATRNNLTKVKFVCAFLTAQILEKSNPRLSLNYLNDKIKSFNMDGLHNIGSLFTLLKINNLLSQDPNTGLIVLQSLCHDTDIDDITRALCLIYQCSLHLYRGSPNHSKELLHAAERILFNSVIIYPIQLKAMFYLLKYSVSIHTHDKAGSKQIMQVINDFIISEQQNHWNSWNEDGNFKIKLTVPFANNLSTELSYQVAWLNSDEFVIIFYFLTGVNFLSDVYSMKNKSKKVFQKCLQILEKQLQELNGAGNKDRRFSLKQLTKKVLRLNYIRYYINYYQVWMNFLQKDFTNIDPLNEFLENYNKNNFTNEELCYYELLIPKIIYLFGIHFQYAGDLKASRYYYMKVRNLTLHKPSTSNTDKTVSILQSYLGIGGKSFQAQGEFNELFVYSTLHLLMITEFEVELISRLPHDREEVTNEKNNSYNFRFSLYLNLASIFTQRNKRTSNSFNMNQASTSQILIVTYNLLLCIYGNNYQENVQNSSESAIKSLTDAIEYPCLTNTFPYMVSLINYIRYLSATTLVDKEVALERCLKLISTDNSSDNEKIISCIILKDYHSQLVERGNVEKADVIETRVRCLYDQLRDKFDFVNSIHLNESSIL